jgi:hypothetical protein
MKSARGMVLILLIAAGSLAKTEICLAVFSQSQILWPGMKKPPGSVRTTSTALKVGVLPVYMREYRESIACDSCHRLSENGMEFFLGNALRRILDSAYSGPEVELVGPHWSLLQSRKVDLKKIQDSLVLPWERWLDTGEGKECREPLIYRPRDFMADQSDKRRLDEAAGALGFSHVFVVRAFRTQVFPKASNNHHGSLEWSWQGALYNAPEGRFEWAIGFSEKRKNMDLDEDLEPSLAKSLRKAFADLPASLEKLLKQEPR